MRTNEIDSSHFCTLFERLKGCVHPFLLFISYPSTHPFLLLSPFAIHSMFIRTALSAVLAIAVCASFNGVHASEASKSLTGADFTTNVASGTTYSHPSTSAKQDLATMSNRNPWEEKRTKQYHLTFTLLMDLVLSSSTRLNADIATCSVWTIMDTLFRDGPLSLAQ